ncbi:hypothetical protein BaRGS_00007180 [Batillaria attramentaria]|uniref:Uncharacterized protein n=1 Tax=Batillaria attramentaria TaxID=370345 RepID=A0ABD0LQG5_9CAEN
MTASVRKVYHEHSRVDCMIAAAFAHTVLALATSPNLPSDKASYLCLAHDAPSLCDGTTQLGRPAARGGRAVCGNKMNQ